jgi:hypothetical protein
MMLRASYPVFLSATYRTAATLPDCCENTSTVCWSARRGSRGKPKTSLLSLRKIFGPTPSKGMRRIRYNDEIYKMYKDVVLSTDMRLKRLMWAGHVVRMEQHRITKKVLCRCLEEKGQWGDHEIDGRCHIEGCTK